MLYVAKHSRYLVVNISRLHLGPRLLIISLHVHQLEFCRSADGHEALAVLVKLLQSLRRLRFARIDTVDLNSVTATRDMQTPVPTVPNRHGLCVKTVVPAAHDKLRPALVVTWHRSLERTPSPFVFG